MRKVLRTRATEFSYKRDAQPLPKLGPWVAVLTEILEGEAQLPHRERRTTQRLFEELQALGNTVRLMPPAYVKPYVKRQCARSHHAPLISKH